ncbi:MAG: TIR domain-containing protein [Prosthecobacter sp.]|uniref:TIR domain-containing protein n=1 Tax=Prosthecobacter sp. TaxID=1965333 RepID=UPI0039011A9C
MRTDNGINEDQFDYDVCLSFAGEDRDYVSQTADILRNKGIRVFYDEYEEAELWGKDLYAHLHEVYSSLARYCVVFISQHYANKLGKRGQGATA